MIKVNVHEAKTNLSKLLNLVRGGETVQICSRNEPVAELRSIEQTDRTGKRPYGIAKGEIEIPDSFFDPMPEEELATWYASDC